MRNKLTLTFSDIKRNAPVFFENVLKETMVSVLNDTLDFITCTITPKMVYRIVNTVLDTHYTLTIEDWCLFNKRICEGTYSKIFGELKPLDIMNWLIIYLDERAYGHEAFLAEEKGEFNKPIDFSGVTDEVSAYLKNAKIAERQIQIKKNENKLSELQYFNLSRRLSIGDVTDDQFNELKDKAKEDERISEILDRHPNYKQDRVLIELAKEIEIQKELLQEQQLIQQQLTEKQLNESS